MSEHYFSADPEVPFRREPLTAHVWGRDLALMSGSGVFSRGHVDAGTAVLLRALDPPTSGDVFLDLGCGYGVVAAALATARPDATVWAVDVNERALRLTRENGESLGLSGIRTATPDDVPPEVVFDEIWSNPPVRIGKDALHDLMLRWLPRLAPEGRAMLVVGKNLGADSLQRWLGDQGWPARRVASAKGFRVLEVRRADEGPA